MPAQLKNAARRIGGRIFYLDLRIIQVIEGDASSVVGFTWQLWPALAIWRSSRRSGRPTERQALLLSGDDLTDLDHAGLRAALDRLEQVDVWALAASRSLRDLAAGPIGELISTAFRVMPRQPRSMETVERLLAAGEAIVKRKRRLDRLTMETVADEAGVTRKRHIAILATSMLLSCSACAGCWPPSMSGYSCL